MDDLVKRAKLYRDRAEELRTMGDEWYSSESLGILNDLARDYEKMAEDLENNTVGSAEIAVAKQQDLSANY